MLDGFPRNQFVRAPDHVFEFAETELGHDLAQFHRDEAHEIHDVRGIAGEPLAQFRVLCRDADRTGIQVTHAHHDATQHDERRGRETKFFRAKQRGNRHVTTGLQLTICLDVDAAAKIVQHECLVRLSKAEFPRAARVFDGRERRCARAAIVTGDQHHVRVRFRNACCDGAHADFAHQLHADARVAIGVLQVMDQLRQIFDGVNVVMRRRRNQTDARRRAASLGDVRENFLTRQLAAFAGLRALRHLDLKLLRVDEIIARHTKASARDLFDRGILRVAVRFQNIARRVFAAFAGVAASAEAVHRHGERFVRLLRDRAVTHRARLETLHNVLDGFNLFERNRSLDKFEIQQAAQGAKNLRAIIQQVGVFAINLFAVEPAGDLEFVNRLRIEQMLFAAIAPLILAARFEFGIDRHRRERAPMPREGLLGDDFDSNALDARRRAGEILVHHVAVDADGFKNLRAAITLHRGDAHLGHRLDDAFDRSLDELLHRRLVVGVLQHVLRDEIINRVVGEIGIDRARAVADEQCEVMHLARLAGFEHQTALRPRAHADEMMMQSRHSQQRGNRRKLRRHAAI